jgi:prepilin-type N-terminal cleavage/methylation domain-containing protein
MGPPPSRGRPGGGRGFSFLELLIVIVLISVLLVLAVERLLVLRYEAERTMVTSVIGAMKSGLYIEFAHAAAGAGRMENVHGSNPMLRLVERPDSYAGEYFGADPKLFEPGTWYFDSRDRALVYLVRFPEQFVTPLPGPPRLRLTVEPDYEDRDRNGRYDAGLDPVRGVRLVALEPYHWKASGGK